MVSSGWSWSLFMYYCNAGEFIIDTPYKLKCKLDMVILSSSFCFTLSIYKQLNTLLIHSFDLRFLSTYMAIPNFLNQQAHSLNWLEFPSAKNTIALKLCIWKCIYSVHASCINYIFHHLIFSFSLLGAQFLCILHLINVSEKVCFYWTSS